LESEKTALNASLETDFDNGAAFIARLIYSEDNENSDELSTFFNERGNPDSIDGEPDETPFTFNVETTSLTIDYEQPINNEDNLLISLAFEQLETTSESPRDFSFQTDNEDLRLEVQYELFINDNSLLTFGTLLAQNTDNSTGLDTIQTAGEPDEGRSGTENESEGQDFYVQYEHKIDEMVSVSLGARYESYDYTINGVLEDQISLEAVNPDTNVNETAIIFGESAFNDVKFDDSALQYNGHIKFAVHNNVDIRLSYSETIDLPDINEFVPTGFFNQDDFTRGLSFNLGNNDLKIGKTKSYELGWDWSFGKGNDRGILGLALFRKESKDGLTTRRVSGSNAGAALANEFNDPDLASAIQQVRTLVASLPNYLRDELIGGSGNIAEEYSVTVNQDNRPVIRGIEVDYSLPLSAIGLPTASLISNITYTERDDRIASIPKDDALFYNLTFDHYIEAIGLTYGFGYNKRDNEKSVSESDGFISTVVTERDPSLDVFIQKNLTDNLLIRLSGENITKAESLGIDEDNTGFRIEDPEVNGAVYRLTLRGRF
jgi:outer membrane receptor protein involved in Fe transport